MVTVTGYVQSQNHWIKLFYELCEWDCGIRLLLFISSEERQVDKLLESSVHFPI